MRCSVLLFVFLLLVASRPATAQSPWRAGLLLNLHGTSLRGAETTYGPVYLPGLGFGGGLTLRYSLRPGLLLRLDARYRPPGPAGPGDGTRLR